MFAIWVDPDRASTWGYHSGVRAFGSPWVDPSSCGSTSRGFEASGGQKTDPMTPSIGRRGTPCWRPLPDDQPIPGSSSRLQHVPPVSSSSLRFSERALVSWRPPALRVASSPSPTLRSSSDPFAWSIPGGCFRVHSCLKPGSPRE